MVKKPTYAMKTGSPLNACIIKINWDDHDYELLGADGNGEVIPIEDVHELLKRGPAGEYGVTVRAIVAFPEEDQICFYDLKQFEEAVYGPVEEPEQTG